MESISGRTAQVGVLAYLLGGGFAVFKSLDDWVGLRRHPLEQWALDAAHRDGGSTAAAAAPAAPPVVAARRRGTPRTPVPAAVAAAPAAAAPSPLQPPPLGGPQPSVLATALRYGSMEGWRASKMAMAGIFVAHSVALGRHGRFDPRAFTPLEVPAALAAGVGAAAYAYLDHLPPAGRAARALALALGVGALDAVRLTRAGGGGGRGGDDD